MLQAAGVEAIAMDLPESEPGSSLRGCADAVVEAIGDRADVWLVAQSMAAFTAPDVALRVPAVRRIVLINPMTPAPGESPGQWWAASGQVEARRAADLAAGRDPDAEFDALTVFLHDVPAEVIATGAGHERAPAASMFAAPPEMKAWPAIRITQLTGRDDRFFPCDFQLRMARERLGIEPTVRPGRHLIALSQPRAVADYLLDDWES